MWVGVTQSLESLRGTKGRGRLTLLSSQLRDPGRPSSPALGVTASMFLVLWPWGTPISGFCLTKSLSLPQRCPVLRHLQPHPSTFHPCINSPIYSASLYEISRLPHPSENQKSHPETKAVPLQSIRGQSPMQIFINAVKVMSSGLLYATPNTGFELLPASSLSLLVCVHLILVCSLQVPCVAGSLGSASLYTPPSAKPSAAERYTVRACQRADSCCDG